MSMKSWAEKEVELACKKEDFSDDYINSCYESALKAYNSLMEDGHSGLSWSITRDIVLRLMDHRPLTPIKESEDIWVRPYDEGNYTSYQCTRMSSLFKYVYSGGYTTYTDLDRVVCVDGDDDKKRYTNKLSRRIVDETFPITLPYMPKNTPYKVIEYSKCVGNYEYKHVKEIVKPDGEIVIVDRYYKQLSFGSGFKEIDYFEYVSASKR